MTTQQVNDILIQFEILQEINIEKKIAEKYPNSENLSEIMLTKMSVGHFFLFDNQNFKTNRSRNK